MTYTVPLHDDDNITGAYSCGLTVVHVGDHEHGDKWLHGTEESFLSYWPLIKADIGIMTLEEYIVWVKAWNDGDE